VPSSAHTFSRRSPNSDGALWPKGARNKRCCAEALVAINAEQDLAPEDPGNHKEVNECLELIPVAPRVRTQNETHGRIVEEGLAKHAHHLSDIVFAQLDNLPAHFAHRVFYASS